MEIKSNWQNGDTFDLLSDYERIKANINEVYQVSTRVVPNYDITTLGTYDYTFIPLANFFNDIVNAIDDVYEHSSFKPHDYIELGKVYEGKGQAFSAEDLNILELNVYYLYHSFMRIIKCWNRCGYETLGLKGGNF